MQIKPYILLADKKTAVYDPHRMYSQSEVYGVVFSDITGEHIRVLYPREFKEQILLSSEVKMPWSNTYLNEVDALFDFNGKQNTREFEIAGSDAVKNIKEQCGNEWFIPSLGESVAAIRCREEIDNLLFHIDNSYRLSICSPRWTSSRYDSYYVYLYHVNHGYLYHKPFYYGLTVTPITFLPDSVQRPEIEKNEVFNHLTNEIHLSNSNELLVEINNGNANIKIYR